MTYKRPSKHDFRVTMVLPKGTPEHWFLEGVFAGIKGKGSKLEFNETKSLFLLGCYRVYISNLSNKTRLVNLYFLHQNNEEDRELQKVLDELTSIGIGWLIVNNG